MLALVLTCKLPTRAQNNYYFHPSISMSPEHLSSLWRPPPWELDSNLSTNSLIARLQEHSPKAWTPPPPPTDFSQTPTCTREPEICHRVNKTFQKFPKSESSNSYHLSTSSSLWRSRPQTRAQLLSCIFPPWRPSQRVLDPNTVEQFFPEAALLLLLPHQTFLKFEPALSTSSTLWRSCSSSSCSFSACTTPFIVLAPPEHLLLLPLTTDGRLCSRYLCSNWLHINLLPHPCYRSLLSNVAQHTTSSRTCTPPFPISQMVSLQLQLLHSSHWLLPKLATWTREENSFILCGNYHSFPVTSIQKH